VRRKAKALAVRKKAKVLAVRKRVKVLVAKVLAAALSKTDTTSRRTKGPRNCAGFFMPAIKI